MKFKILAAVATAIAVTPLLFGSAPAKPQKNENGTPKRIAWYATLKSGLAEAKRSNRPILFTSAAPQCLGVPGIW